MMIGITTNDTRTRYGSWTHKERPYGRWTDGRTDGWMDTSQVVVAGVLTQPDRDLMTERDLKTHLSKEAQEETESPFSLKNKQLASKSS